MPTRVVIPREYADLLASTALAHVATIGPDGEPQYSPVRFDWDGTYLRFAQVSGYQQKVWNLRRQVGGVKIRPERTTQMGAAPQPPA